MRRYLGTFALLMVLCMGMLPNGVLADTVLLNNGSVIDGEIMFRTNHSVYIRVNHTWHRIPVAKIAKIILPHSEENASYGEEYIENVWDDLSVELVFKENTPLNNEKNAETEDESDKLAKVSEDKREKSSSPLLFYDKAEVLLLIALSDEHQAQMKKLAVKENKREKRIERTFEESMANPWSINLGLGLNFGPQKNSNPMIVNLQIIRRLNSWIGFEVYSGMSWMHQMGFSVGASSLFYIAEPNKFWQPYIGIGVSYTYVVQSFRREYPSLNYSEDYKEIHQSVLIDFPISIFHFDSKYTQMDFGLQRILINPYYFEMENTFIQIGIKF